LAVALSSQPQHERSWAQGAIGERDVARRLEKAFLGDDVELLHDRGIPGRRANIDHLVIAPGGVTVIDAKNVTGRIKVERVGLPWKRRSELRIRGRTKTSLVEGVERQMQAVREALVDVGLAADIRGCLCFTRRDELPMFGKPEIRGIALVGYKRAIALARRPSDTDPCDVALVAEALRAGLPPA
jgi:hypothetical protein